MTEHAFGRLKLAMLAIVAAITFFANNAVLVPDIMESRNLVTAREMVEKQNWLIPTMNGEIRLEKPPLPTWIAAAIETASPDNIAAQRAAAGCMGMLLALFFFLYARRRTNINATAATLLLCTCYNVVLMGRTVSWDIYCHAFMMGAIYFLAGAFQGKGKQWSNFLWAGVMMGLSILSKGPVSLYALFLPWLIATLIFNRPSMKGKWMPLAMMAGVAIVIGCWWYGYIYTCRTDALQAVAAKESGSWINRNVRPWWYYHAFYLETGIWAPLMLTSIFFVIFRYAREGAKKAWTSLAWMAASLLLLSLLPEKKTRYLLPLLLPAALVMAQTITGWIKAFRQHSYSPKTEKIWMRINCWLLTGVVALLPAAAWVFVYQKGNISLAVWIAFSIFFLITACYLAIAAIKLRPMHMLWGVALLFCVAECGALPYIKPIINNPDMHGLSLTVGNPKLEGIPFYYNVAEPDGLRIELVYAARREIHPLDLTDSAAVARALPFALLTHTGASEISPHISEHLDTTYMGLYDDNRRPKGTRRYSPLFIYHLTLVKPSK